MIKLVNVSKYYTTGDVTNLGLRNINLELHKNEIVAITGESGSGKSTLLNVISKMDTFDEGEIYYRGNETSYFGINDMDNFRKDKVGFIFQNYNIIDSYTVLDNVMLPYTISGTENKEARAKAIDLIEKVGLKKRINHRGSQLSGGEKQRCVIARALASNAEILACDEPTGNLDSKTSVEIINLIKEVAKDKLVLIVTHNFELVKDIATRKITVHDGEITEDIILKETENNDVDENLDLDYVSVPKKVSFHIALKNILKTPKKTILTSLVFLFVCVFAISLYQSIMHLRETDNNSNPFVIKDEEKLLVYDINHQSMDLSYFDNLKSQGLIYDYAYNKFYSQKSIYQFDQYLGDVDNYNIYYIYAYDSNPSNFSEKKLTAGRLPKDDSEVVVLLPESASDLKTIDVIGKEIYIKETEDICLKKTFTVVGYQIRNDIDGNFAVLTQNKILEDYFTIRTLFYYYDLEKLPFAAYNGENEISSESYNIRYDFTSDVTYLKYDSARINVDSAKVKDCTYASYKLFDGFDIDVRIMETDEDFKDAGTDYYIGKTLVIYIGKDIINKINANAYEVYVYTKVNKILQGRLNNDNKSFLKVSEYTTASELERFVNNLWSYLAIILSSFSLFVVYFISYFVLSKVYQSKKKDYTIIRTLGVTKKDMRFVVKSEILITSISLAVLVYILVFVLGKVILVSPFTIFNKISVFTSILYFELF